MSDYYRISYRRLDQCYHVHTGSGNIWMVCPTLRGAMRAMYLAYRAMSPGEYDRQILARRNKCRQQVAACYLWCRSVVGEAARARFGKAR